MNSYASPNTNAAGIDHRRAPRLFERGSWARMDLLEPRFPYREDLLQFIWAAQLFDHRALRTTDGLVLEVLKAGTVQQDSGPDLEGAQLRIGGQLWAGNVEVHVRSSEWFGHGHHHDPSYNNVILHVVHEHDAEVTMLNGGQPPTVELVHRIPTDRIVVYDELMKRKAFVPCARMVRNVDRVLVGNWLKVLHSERSDRRTKEIAVLHAGSVDNAAGTLYQMLAKAFGMRVNAGPFSMLARAVPLELLQKYRSNPLRIGSLLFGQAGLLNADHCDDHPRRLLHEYRILARMHDLIPLPVATWKFARMRPGNFPTIRIAQLAQLVIRCNGSFAALLKLDKVEALRSFLCVEPGPFWTDHYTFSRVSAPRIKRLGRMGADHIIINAIVPMLLLLGRKQGRKELTERAIGLMEQLPAESNHALDQWARSGLTAINAAESQALLELRNSYCSERRCLSCRIGVHLLKEHRPLDTPAIDEAKDN